MPGKNDYHFKIIFLVYSQYLNSPGPRTYSLSRAKFMYFEMRRNLRWNILKRTCKRSGKNKFRYAAKEMQHIIFNAHGQLNSYTDEECTTFWLILKSLADHTHQ